MIEFVLRGCLTAAIAAAVAVALHGAASAQAQAGAPAASAQLCPTTAQMLEQPIECVCTVLASETGEEVWGTDIYTDDSSICRAARHAGAVDVGGGVVRVTLLPGRRSYPGSQRNGVTTGEYGDWSRSFSVAAGTLPAAVDLNQCPAEFLNLRGHAGVLNCTCSTAQTAEGTVWGTDVYADASAICQAAVHAGAISRSGGLVRLRSMPPQQSYTGSKRNGVTSESDGAGEGSFSFAR